jgi:hypothetical protein
MSGQTSFKIDILPLFTERDIKGMSRAFGDRSTLLGERADDRGGHNRTHMVAAFERRHGGPSYKQSAPACDMLGTIRIFGRRSFAQADFLCLQARIGRCCRLSPAIRSSAAPSSTAFYWELLEQERSLAPLPCRGSSAVSDPTGRSRSGRQGPSSRSFCLPWRATGRLRSAEASSLACHGLLFSRP